MKGGIARRFAAMLALVGVLASGLTGLYSHLASRTLLTDAAQTQLLTATQVLGRRISESIKNTHRDVQLLAGYPESAAILQIGNPTLRQQAEDDLAKLFAQMLRVHPEYFQLRLISAADHGMERVRIDRNAVDGDLTRVPPADLQEKGHFLYVSETLLLPKHAAYISRAQINQEHGAHAGEGKPSLLIATPVYGDSDDKALGLIVVNVDLDGLFDLLGADLPREFQLYLSDARGGFLIHPDPAKAFAFDRGQTALLQNQFANTQALLSGDQEQVTSLEKPADGPALIAAFARLELQPSTNHKRVFILGLAQPLADVLAQSDRLGAIILRIVLAFSAISVVLALILTRTFTRPLKIMVRAVEHFGLHHSSEPLPVERRDEIGVLARSFTGMQQQITAQVQALREHQRELDYLASHDSLTGLPNRRLFYDRLEQALARARRSETPMALLFIDLDHFKAINDQYGHTIGDIVLREAAKNIRLSVRESDTVARLGGDEFVVLLDAATNKNDIANVAQKIIDMLTSPLMHAGVSFQIGASIGISLFPDNGRDSTELIIAADQSMYAAKNAGRNGFYFSTALPSEAPISRAD